MALMYLCIDNVLGVLVLVGGDLGFEKDLMALSYGRVGNILCIKF